MIAIYGAGQYGKNLHNVISNYEEIDFFIDKFSHETTVRGVPVIDLVSAKSYRFETIYNSVATHEDDVMKELSNENIVSFVATIKKYPEIIDMFIQEKYLWLESASYLPNDTVVVRKLLQDTVSKNFFDAWVQFRKSGFDMNYYPYPTNSLNEQYFIKNFIGKSKKFIDCGAYTGDTVKAFYNHNKSGKVISFEPDPKNVNLLQKISKGKNVLIYPMGVASSSQVLKFNCLGSGGSFSKEGTILLPVTSLDETVYNFNPDYIKMDIEGTELDALKGARNIIKDFTPNLAISIYHKAQDLWEIPLYINSINPNYEYFIRCHNHLCLETILYCRRKR